MKKLKCNYNCKFDFKELLFFNRLIMPQILTVLFWIACVCVVISGLTTMFRFSFFGGLFGIIVGLILTRIGFEMISVAFSINRNLEKLVEFQTPVTEQIVAEVVDDINDDSTDKDSE